jgi:hypothetical protein
MLAGGAHDEPGQELAGPSQRLGDAGSEDSSKVFLNWLLGSALATILGYSLAAVVVDPRGYFRTGIFPASVLNSRQLKQALFREYSISGEVDGIVLGSSRSMLVAPKVLSGLGCGRFFNFAVDSARAEDYLAVFRWSVAQGAKPGRLLLGLDVEALHDAAGLDERLLTNPSLMAGLGAGGWDRLQSEARSWLAIGRAVFSGGYAWGMLASLRARSGDFLETRRFEVDGGARYPRWERERREGTFDQDGNIRGSCDEYKRRFAQMAALSPERIEVLKRLITEASSRQVKVVLWITPLHPRVVDVLERDTEYDKMLDQTRALIRELATRFGVIALDLSDPRRFGGNDTDWWDGSHMDEENGAKLTVRLAEELRCDGV